jgi:NADH:ubiquinone oxidoreductase subunit E
MLTVILKAVKMMLSYYPKNSQDAAVLAALKAVQDTEKNHPHKDQVQKFIPITSHTKHKTSQLHLQA